MTIQVDWNTDSELVDLPSIVEVPDDIDEEDVADWLSHENGWYVNSLTTNRTPGHPTKY